MRYQLAAVVGSCLIVTSHASARDFSEVDLTFENVERSSREIVMPVSSDGINPPQVEVPVFVREYNGTSTPVNFLYADIDVSDPLAISGLSSRGNGQGFDLIEVVSNSEGFQLRGSLNDSSATIPIPNASYEFTTVLFQIEAAFTGDLILTFDSDETVSGPRGQPTVGYGSYTFRVTQIPEPTTAGVLGVGVTALLLRRRRRLG